MNIASLSINRPVLATVMSIVIVLFGIVGFSYLGVREFPSVDPPIITVTTNYTGANAEVIESQITEPLEDAISGIAGIRTITSTSSDGRSTISVEFDLSVDLEAAANDVRDKVSGAIRLLPQDADPPVTVKSDADAETILSITVQSDQRDLLDLTDFATINFKERLQTIPGVSNIRIWGEKKYSMRLELVPSKLAAYGLTPFDVQTALNRENVEIPSGRIEGSLTDLTIRTFGRLSKPSEFEDLIISEKDGRLIKFKDIGRAYLAPENDRTILRGDGGVPMVGIALSPQPGANYIDIVDEAFRRVEMIQKNLPDDITVGVALDTTTNIRKAIGEVEETILIAFLLVVLVIFAFLRDWRTTLIPIIAIPISLIGAFFIMYVAGFSINILTLLAVVLATGLVVDDAIVVMENIYAKVERGQNPKKAAHEGSKEIFFAIVSTTITLAAVFLPVIFLSGLTGRLFREFGIVVAGAVIISAFVSLTLTPMMSSRLLRKKEKETKFFQRTEVFFEKLINGYHHSLSKFMNRPMTAVLVMLGSFAMLIGIGRMLPSELAPLEDKSRFAIFATAPEGTSFDKMDSYLAKIIEVVDTLPEKASILSVTSPGFGASISTNTGFVRVTLNEPSKRNKSQAELAKEINAIVRQYNFARVFINQEQTIGGGRMSGMPVQFVLQAPSFEKLKEVVPVFMEKAQAEPAFSAVDVDLKFNKPELQVSIDREKAREMGVSTLDIAQTMQLYFAGQRYGYFIKDGKQYQVIGQAARANRDEPVDLKQLTVKNDRGELIQLDNLVKLDMQSTPPILYRNNRYVSATISATPSEGYTIGQGIEVMDKIASDVLDESFNTSLAGTSKEFAESSSSLIFAFVLALVLIYLTLAAQFESFLDPLLIMFTVPLAIAGAVLSLWLNGDTLNIFSQIGMIVLVGIVTKNGILIVEFANQRKKDGLSSKEAAIDSATQRFRPILMTSLATILGALPIALALGESSTSRIPMGIAIIGGLTYSLVLTLYVIPALYSIMTPNNKKANA